MKNKTKKFVKTIIILFIIFSILLLLIFNLNTPNENVNKLCLDNINLLVAVSGAISLNEKKEEIDKKILTQEEQIDLYVEDICEDYGVDPYIVKSIIWHESRYNPNAANGNCVGLMQISTYWNAKRANELGIIDFYDPYSNILIGVDIISDMLNNNNDIKLTLMLYNMDHDTAYSWYSQGKISDYALSVLDRAESLRRGDI